MKFNKDKATFGRHETFPLRYSWLTKGFQAIVDNPYIFNSPEVTTTLGVGKNMVKSIQFWLTASQMIKNSKNKIQPTELGSLIFDKEKGFDPYLEDEATLWLIHWLISTNPENAPAWFWFFNRFHKSEFTQEESAESLIEFARQNVNKETAPTTLKVDTAILIRMYSRSEINTRTSVEEALDSPLSLLRLVSQVTGGRKYFSYPEEREDLTLGVFGFALLTLLETMEKKTIPIGELMYSKTEYPSLGAVFRLTENSLISKLEILAQKHPNVFDVRETAGIHQVYLLKVVDPLILLKQHYSHDNLIKEAA
jgi:hypothetical protein